MNKSLALLWRYGDVNDDDGDDEKMAPKRAAKLCARFVCAS